MQQFEVKTGYACNNNCIFCLNQNKKYYKAFPLDDIFRYIRQAASRGCWQLIISGGEPLISPHFFDILDYARGCGFRKIDIQTNARMLCYEAFVEKMLRIGPLKYYFLVSLHFPDKRLHNFYTRAEGFDETIAGIKNLARKNLGLMLNTVIMKQNLKLLEDITAFGRSLGAKRHQLRMIDSNLLKGLFHDFVPTMRDAAREVRAIISKSKGLTEFSVHEIPLCVLGEDMKEYLSPAVNPERKNLTIGNIVVASDMIVKNQFSFSDCCEACRYRSACYGIRNEYGRRYGFAELKPIRK
jgi:MoaA/NifB/PqqE/SkfB family radical SAM enzyme